MSLPRKELYDRAIWGLNQQFKGRERTREYDILKFLWQRTIDSVPSYLGHFKYFNSYNILKEIFDETGWDYIPDDLFRTNFQKTRKSPITDDFLFPYFN